MIPFASFLCGLAIAIAASLGGCSTPQIVQATDCRGAVTPCGIVLVDHTDAMSSQPVTIPVSAVPGIP